MGDIWRGSGFGKEKIGYCKGGNIYRGNDFTGQLIGEYRNGKIYEGTGFTAVEIGGYYNGTIYKKDAFSNIQIGSYNESGEVYWGYSVLGRTLFGHYSCEEAGAAALLLLLCKAEEPVSWDSMSPNYVPEAPKAAPQHKAGDHPLGQAAFCVIAAICSVLLWYFAVKMLVNGEPGSIYIVLLLASSSLASIVSLFFHNTMEFAEALTLVSIIAAAAVDFICVLFLHKETPLNKGSTWFAMLVAIPLFEALFSFAPVILLRFCHRAFNKMLKK